MSYHIWISHGYGICVDDIDGVTMGGLLEFVHKAPEFEKNFLEWLNESYEEPIDELDVSEVLDEWDDNWCYKGIGPILRDVINEAEDLRMYIADDFGGVQYLMLSPRYPWSEISAKERELTQEALDEIFHKYLRLLTNKKINIDYQSVENGG